MGHGLPIMLSAINILTSLPAIRFYPGVPKLLRGLGVVWAAAIIALLLWPQPKSYPATGRAQ